MMISSFPLPCGARLTVEQEDMLGLYGPAWLSPVSPRVRLDRLPVTVSEARALLEAAGGRYWGSSISVSYGRASRDMLISGIELTEDEARAIADGGDPLTVLGVHPARVVLSIVRLPADG